MPRKLSSFRFPRLYGFTGTYRLVLASGCSVMRGFVGSAPSRQWRCVLLTVVTRAHDRIHVALVDG